MLLRAVPAWLTLPSLLDLNLGFDLDLDLVLDLTSLLPTLRLDRQIFANLLRLWSIYVHRFFFIPG